MIKEKEGLVQGLYISIKGEGRKERDSIIIDSKGIREDKFYAKDENRAILITAKESYDLVQQKNIEIAYGSLGENIVINLNPYALKEGDKISIGDVVLVITQNCTICNSLSKVHVDVPAILQEDRGIFAKALQDGEIKLGDSVTFL
ncbi:MOSC domain-containing protein [Sulfurimonas sp. SAG-AH-194-I05]|nr:MOSC domain-containing protein [Sulfurimonas sp. SAG-AH-194-I05]MDF1876150.1 MOSC domain-containing protein [Sulfurimonas sp. SAG-AH-194-I05]